ncbi:hypothetical protein [Reinekea sp. G2M2-21]|uniref:hypothetical protein n=1 Tax=Reinekea sp. G2M2-21 TaxID=2788942 RepID=UPI0018A88B96|nr:hypothetical protein [Reinekea sp. G2M2-21]
MATISSFSIGSTLVKGKFTAIIIKFVFDDKSTLLCSFGRDQIVRLLQALTEYIQYLTVRKVSYDADAHKLILKSNEPGLTQDDVEQPPVSSVVTGVSGVVKRSHDIELAFRFQSSGDEKILVLVPVLSEWLLGYISNTLNEFDEDGNLIVPHGSGH